MNRVIVSSIISLLLIALLAVGYFYYTGYRENFSKPEVALPPDASLIISGNLSQWVAEINTLPFWKNADTTFFIGKLKRDMAMLLQKTNTSTEVANFMDAGKTIVSLHVTGSEKMDVLYLIPVKPDLSIESMQKTLRGGNTLGTENKVRNFAGANIYELRIPESQRIFTFAISGGIFMGSFTSFLVEDAIRQQATGKVFGGNKVFESDYESAIAKNGFVLCINYAKLKNLLGSTLQSEKTYKLNEFDQWAGWSVQQVGISKTSVTTSGTMDVSDSSQIATVFKADDAGACTVTEVLPASTSAFQSFIFKNSSEWLQKYRPRLRDSEAVAEAVATVSALEKKIKVAVSKKFLSLISTEITLAITGTPSTTYDANVLAFFKLQNADKAKITLKAFTFLTDGSRKKAEQEIYKSYTIGYIPVDGLLPSLFGNSFTSIRKSYYTIYNGYLVMANRPASLRNYIEEIQAKNLLNGNKNNNSMLSAMKHPCNYVLFINPSAALPVWKSLASKNNISFLSLREEYFSNFSSFVYTLSATNNGKLACASTLLLSDSENKKALNQLWVHFYDTTLIKGPYCFLKGDEQFTLLQDAGNMVSCMDNRGNIKWKMPFNGIIQGDIMQAPNSDMGLAQFIFCTDKKIYLVNENGNIANRYPLKVPSTPVSLFAQPQINFFFLPSQNKQVYVFSYDGRPAPSWGFMKTDGIANGHFNVNDDKSMIAFADENKTAYLYSTAGNLKLKTGLPSNVIVSSIEVKSNDSIHWLTAADSSGILYRLNTDGTLEQKTLGTSSPITYFSTAGMKGAQRPQHLALDNHHLYLYNDDLSLAGKLSITGTFKPPISQISKNNKSYVAASSLADSLYVINDSGILLEGFPVYAPHYTILGANKAITIVIRDSKNNVKCLEWIK